MTKQILTNSDDKQPEKNDEQEAHRSTHQAHDKRQPTQHDNQGKDIKSVKSIRTTDSSKRGTKRARKVKFAEHLVEQRMYDRASSPNAETYLVPKANKTAQPVVTSLEHLSPPLSLVAHFDLAAKKLGARGPTSHGHSHKDRPHHGHQDQSPQATSSSVAAPQKAQEQHQQQQHSPKHEDKKQTDPNHQVCPPDERELSVKTINSPKSSGMTAKNKKGKD